MNHAVYTGARLLLGLIFTIFGVNGMMYATGGTGFIPMPPPAPEMAAAMEALFTLGYLMPLVKGVQIVSGLLLLSGKYVNLALALLAPVLVNIVCVHVFIDPSGLPMALGVSVLFARVLKERWSHVAPLLQP